MAREDIIGGLKSALTRGYSLKDAMISFYNAGYKKEDIEEAARKLQYELAENKDLKDLILQSNSQALNPRGVSLPQNQVARQNAYNQPTINKGLLERTSSASISNKSSGSSGEGDEMSSRGFKLLSRASKKGEQGDKTKVSAYKPGTSMKVITIVLIVLLVLLLGIMGAVFIFRNQIIQFFNHLLSG